MKGNASLINEIYSKSCNQSQDILDKINEIENGIHDIVLDKIKTKILEKMENLENSMKLGEHIILELNQTEVMKWKRRFENIRVSFVNNEKALKDAIKARKDKMSNLMKSSKDYKSNPNLSNLQEEYISLRNTLKITSDIEQQGYFVIGELESQKNILQVTYSL